MGQKENGQKRRKYDASFKEEILKMVLNGRPVPEITQCLGIGENLIYKWKSPNNTKEQQPTAVSKVGNVTSPTAWQDQSELLHKRIRELEGERDIRLGQKRYPFSVDRPNAGVSLHSISSRGTCGRNDVPVTGCQP